MRSLRFNGNMLRQMFNTTSNNGHLYCESKWSPDRLRILYGDIVWLRVVEENGKSWWYKCGNFAPQSLPSIRRCFSAITCFNCNTIG